jgi:hypothetical protein
MALLRKVGKSEALPTVFVAHPIVSLFQCVVGNGPYRAFCPPYIYHYCSGILAS